MKKKKLTAKEKILLGDLLWRYMLEQDLQMKEALTICNLLDTKLELIGIKEANND